MLKKMYVVAYVVSALLSAAVAYTNWDKFIGIFANISESEKPITVESIINSDKEVLYIYDQFYIDCVYAYTFDSESCESDIDIMRDRIKRIWSNVVKLAYKNGDDNDYITKVITRYASVHGIESAARRCRVNARFSYWYQFDKQFGTKMPVRITKVTCYKDQSRIPINKR